MNKKSQARNVRLAVENHEGHRPIQEEIRYRRHDNSSAHFGETMRKRVANRRDKEQAEREVHVDSWPVPGQQGPSLDSRGQIARSLEARGSDEGERRGRFPSVRIKYRN